MNSLHNIPPIDGAFRRHTEAHLARRSELKELPDVSEIEKLPPEEEVLPQLAQIHARTGVEFRSFLGAEQVKIDKEVAQNITRGKETSYPGTLYTAIRDKLASSIERRFPPEFIEDSAMYAAHIVDTSNKIVTPENSQMINCQNSVLLAAHGKVLDILDVKMQKDPEFGAAMRQLKNQTESIDEYVQGAVETTAKFGMSLNPRFFAFDARLTESKENILHSPSSRGNQAVQAYNALYGVAYALEDKRFTQSEIAPNLLHNAGRIASLTRLNVKSDVYFVEMSVKGKLEHFIRAAEQLSFDKNGYVEFPEGDYQRGGCPMQVHLPLAEDETHDYAKELEQYCQREFHATPEICVNDKSGNLRIDIGAVHITNAIILASRSNNLLSPRSAGVQDAIQRFVEKGQSVTQ